MDFVDNAFNERSGTIRGRAIFDNKDGLLTPGIFARIALYGGDVDAFLIPDTAIVSDQARKIVFTVNADDVIAATSVTLGPMYEGLRVIKAGLKAGRSRRDRGRGQPRRPTGHEGRADRRHDQG